MTLSRVVVVGGSIAAATAASTLRVEGYDGELVVLSEERHAPYSRVPLSKGVVDGSEPVESTFLPALPADVELRTGARAAALDPRTRTVRLEDGSELRYDGLVIATGSRARTLASPGAGELTLRTLDDALALRAAADGAESALVVGGGFLAMELASTLTSLGIRVTVLARQRPMLRLIGPWLSSYLIERAREHGVTIEIVPDARLIGSTPTALEVGGERRTADLIVTAVGDLPNVEWMASSGLAVDGGVHIDAQARVAPGIVAAGDVVTLARLGRPRSPHWTSAVEQAQLAARTLLGRIEAPYSPEAYYWTEQFGVDLKMSGLPPVAEPEVLEGDPGAGSALLRWTDGERPTAATINHRIPIVRLKKLGWRAVPEPATPAIAG